MAGASLLTHASLQSRSFKIEVSTVIPNRCYPLETKKLWLKQEALGTLVSE